MGSEGVEDRRRHLVTSQNLKAWNESRGTHENALDGEDWYDVRNRRLITIPDGTAKEEESITHASNRHTQSFILLLFIGYPLTLVSSTNLHVSATTVCLLALRPTSLTFVTM